MSVRFCLKEAFQIPERSTGNSFKKEGKKNIYIVVCVCTLLRVRGLYHVGSGKSKEMWKGHFFLSAVTNHINSKCMQPLSNMATVLYRF